RIVAVSSDLGVASLDLPGSFVADASVDEGAAIGAGEPYQITFNEYMAVDSVQPGTVNVTRFDTGDAVDVSVTPIKVLGGAAQRFALDFARSAGIDYEIRVDSARNLRSGSLWVPFVGHVKAAADSAKRPAIVQVQGGVFNRGENAAVTIKGSGFGPDA